MSTQAHVRDTLINATFKFKTVDQARGFVRESGLRHYEIWDMSGLIEFGQTPTRVRRTENQK